MIKNKKGKFEVFGFFFILMIFSSLFFFITLGMHYLLYDYAITQTMEVAGMVLAADGESMTNINNLAASYLGTTDYYDLLFLVLLVSAFIESTIASLKTKEEGFLSFFGMVTIGNVFLIFILSYATQVQGWFLNEVLFNVILVTTETPIITFFFNYSMFIAVFWYLWLLGINQVNLEGVKEKVPNIFNRESLTSSEGRFEE
jgi:hypothetical protein